jgi:6-phosphogluconolactonase
MRSSPGWTAFAILLTKNKGPNVRNKTLPLIEIFPDPERLIQSAAEKVVRLGAEAIQKNGIFTLALSGGSTPRPLYALLAKGTFATSIDWSRVHLFWGDERCVPPDDPRSNYRMVRESLLDVVPIRPANIHRIHGEDEPKGVAAAYEQELRIFFGCAAADGPPLKGFDLVLLGMGKDGHTASLFPGLPAVNEQARWVMALFVEPIWRITLTPVVINKAKNVILIISGSEKAERLHRVIEGPLQPELMPVQVIRPAQGQLLWLVDEAAAGRLTEMR